MDIIRMTYPFESLDTQLPQVLAIGYFDGVHTGHQQLLRKTIDLAKSSTEERIASVMTFDPHPREVLGTGRRLPYITPLSEKLERFADCGIQRCYILTFDRALALLTPEQFVHNVLISLRVDVAVVGFNFTFGHLGSGTAEIMRELGGDRVKVQIVRPIMHDGIKVSSTRIRSMLHDGQVALASEMLGRPYSITGTVVSGAGRGRTIGIPTANIEPDDVYLIPANGVYAVNVYFEGVKRSAVMNIGTKPTFEDDRAARTLEAHLLDYSGDLYGRNLRVEWVDRIRDERKFSSASELVEQIHKDIEKARTILFTS